MKFPAGKCRYCGHTIYVDMYAHIAALTTGRELTVTHSCRPQAEAYGTFVRKQLDMGRVMLDRKLTVAFPPLPDSDRLM